MGDAQDIEMDGSSEYDEENSSQASSNINNPTSKKHQHEDNRRGKGADSHTQNGTSGGKKKNPGKHLAQESSMTEKLSDRELKKIKQQIERLEHQPGRTKKKKEYHAKQSEKKSPESDHSLEQRKDEKESMSSAVLGSSMGNSGDRFSRKNMMETFQLGASLSVGASQDSIGFIPDLVTSQSTNGGSSSKNNKNGNNLQNTNNTNTTAATNSSIFKTTLPTLTAAASAEGSTKIQIRYQNPENQPANSSSKTNNNNLNNGNKSSDAASINNNNNNNSNNGMGIIVTEDDSEVSASCDHFDQEPGENADEEEDTSLHLISKPTPSYNSKSVLLPTPSHTLPSQFSVQAANNENQPANTINIPAGNLPGCESTPETGSVSGGNPSIAAAGKVKKSISKRTKDSSISITSPVSSTANITAPTAMHLQSSNSQEGSASKIQVICTTNEAKATTSRQPSRSSFSNSNTAGSTQVAQPQTVAAIPTHSSPQVQTINGSNSNSAVITLIKQNNQNNNNNHNHTQQTSTETIQQIQTQNIMLQPTSSSNLIQMRITPEETTQQAQDKSNPLQESSTSVTKQTPLSNSATAPDCDNSNTNNLPQKASSSHKNSMNTTSQTTNPPALNPSADHSPTKAMNPIAIPAQHGGTNSKQIVKSPISIKNPSAKSHVIMPLPSGHNMITIPIAQNDYFELAVAPNENEENVQPSKKKRKGGRPSSKIDRNNSNKSGNTNTKSDQLESKLSREEIPVVVAKNHSKFMRDIVPFVSERAEKRKTDNEYKERMKKGPLNQNVFSDQPSLFLRLNDYQDDEQRNRLLQAEDIAEKNNNAQKAEKIILKEGQLFSNPQLLTLQPFLNYLPQQPKVPLVFTLARNGGQDTEELTANNQTITHLQSKETNGISSQGISSRIKRVDSQVSLMDQTNVISDTIVKKFKSSNILEGFNEPFSSLHTDFAASYLSPEYCKGVLSSFNRHQDFATEDQNIEY